MNTMPSRALLLFTSFCLSVGCIAQDERPPRTVFDSLSVTGGFFNTTLRFANVMQTDVLLMGFGAGAHIDHWLGVGVAGAFSTSTIKNAAYEDYLLGRTTADLDGLELRYGYGGVLFTPLIAHRSAVHLAVPVLVGVGGVAYSYPRSNSGSDSNQRNRTDGQAFFVVEPGVELEVSVVGALRIGVGGSYLYTSELDLPNTSPNLLRNFMARMTISVGQF